MTRDGDSDGAAATWGRGSSASPAVLADEHPHEKRVSAYIGEMPFLWLGVDDEPSAQSDRGVIERGSVALLSAEALAGVESASSGWLGGWSSRAAIRSSGLWNVNHVNDDVFPFLATLDRWIGSH